MSVARLRPSRVREPGRRVLHVSTRFSHGGAERNMAHLLGWQLDNGFAVDCAVGKDSDLEAVPPGVRTILVPELTRPVRPGADTSALVSLRRVLREGAYDIVHTHESKAGVVGRLACHGLPPIVVHSIHMSSFGPGYHPMASRAFLAAERVCARRTDWFVCVGDEVREHYLAHGVGRPEQYTTIRSPVGVARFLATRDWAPHRRRIARLSFGLPDVVPLVVAVGRLEPRKRIDLVFRELAPLLRARRLHLAVAGKGPDREALERYAANLAIAPHVTFLGQLHDVAELLGSAGALVHASRVEGVPQVVVQALASGIPVVATEVEGLREVPGASVRVVARDGAHLAGAVEDVLAEPLAPPPPEAFAAWTEARVEHRLLQLHARIEEARR